MRPDTGTAAPEVATTSAADAAHRIYCELRDVYDVFEARLAAAAWDEATAIVPRLRELEAALQPFAAARRAAASAADAAPWARVDALARDVGARQATALELTTAARDAVAAELARLHGSRSKAARYRRDPETVPIFASRRA